MALFIKVEDCINCGACVEPCPNDAIYAGGEQYEYLGKMSPTLNNDVYYIVPDKCTECEGFHETQQCVAACPVDCIIKDPNRAETKEQLLEKKEKLHPE